MARYSKTSPWNKTKITDQGYLDVLKIRPIPARDTDLLYAIESQYTYRPDLLAFDYYGSPKLWWVFAQRNMNVIKDPIYDMRAGVEIFLPDPDLLKQRLGI